MERDGSLTPQNQGAAKRPELLIRQSQALWLSVLGRAQASPLGLD